MILRYDVQRVCLNGHHIVDITIKNNEDFFCDKCGEKVIGQCPDCNHPFESAFYTKDQPKPVPSYCKKCGRSFPWTQRKKKREEDAKEQTDKISISNIEKICSRFHLVTKELSNRQRNKTGFVVQDEYDTQDLFIALLRLFFDDIRKEEWTPSYAGSCSRVDFLLKKEGIIVEIKKTRNNHKDRQIGEELIIDIKKYKTHPNCKTLICFIYDPAELISNPNGLENDLRHDEKDFICKVIIAPKRY